MREIKFRVWDGEDFIDFWVGNSNELLNELFISDQYAFQQYTEHKDKNGVDIYEGDIMANELNPKGFVVDSLYVAYEMWRAYESFSKSTDWEVIGNIYKNPELK